MLFNSAQFLGFFLVVVVLYFSLNHRYRWPILLLSSYYFYLSWKIEYGILIVISTLVTYVGALLIAKHREQKKKKLFLVLSVGLNLIILFVFKYFNFFGESAADFFKLFNFQFSSPILHLALPLGISFCTFRVIAYVADVYRGKIPAERHLGLYATHVVFWPELLAGPIERAGNLLPQFLARHDFDYERVVNGLKLMAWGMFKKVVVADGFAVLVNKVYGDTSYYYGPALAIATVFYSFQIFCDFSGYSDIAIGAGQVMGFKLMDNFKAPYLARSIADFWRRWHISLSSWFQDYVFTPLYLYAAKFKLFLNFSAAVRHLLSFTVTMLIGEALLGLWHGANWTFVAFGLWHGAAIILYYIFRKRWDAMPPALQIFSTFIIVNFGWIFFRAKDISEALHIIGRIFTPFSWLAWINVKPFFLHQEYESVILLLPLAAVIAAHFIEWKHGNLIEYINKKSALFRWSLYYLLIMAIFLFGTFGSQEFIYFNF